MKVDASVVSGRTVPCEKTVRAPSTFVPNGNAKPAPHAPSSTCHDARNQSRAAPKRVQSSETSAPGGGAKSQASPVPMRASAKPAA